MADDQDPREALRPLLDRIAHPCSLDADGLVATVGQMAPLFDSLDQPDLANWSRTVCEDRSDRSAWQELGHNLGDDIGWEIYEENLTAPGATLLLRAHALDPGERTTALDLVQPLETLGDLETLFDVLSRVKQAGGADFMVERLRALFACSLERMEVAREALPRLKELGTQGIQPEWVQEIEGQVARAGALEEAGLLDDDRRSWLLIHAGTLVLSQSSPPSHEDAIRDLAALVEAGALSPERVLFPSDPGSRELGPKVAEALGLPPEPWPQEGREEPGLIVVEEFHSVPASAWYHPLRTRRPGQALFAHVVKPTDHGYAPDLAGFFHHPGPAGSRDGTDHLLAMLGALEGLGPGLGAGLGREDGLRPRIPALGSRFLPPGD